MDNLSKYYIPIRGKVPRTEGAVVARQSPLPPEVIPNYMGINLSSVDRIEWTRRPDGQLVDLTIYFIPDEGEDHV